MLKLRDQAVRIYKSFIEFIGLCVPKPEIAPNRQRAATKKEVISFDIFTSFPSVLYITSGFLNLVNEIVLIGQWRISSI